MTVPPIVRIGRGSAEHGVGRHREDGVRARCLVILAALTLAACTGGNVRDEALVECSGERVLEVTARAKSDLYLWNGGEVSSAQLRSEIEAEDRSCPVSEIRLLRGGRDVTIANCIEIVTIAHTIGAKAFYEHTTLGLKPIVLSE